MKNILLTAGFYASMHYIAFNDSTIEKYGLELPFLFFISMLGLYFISDRK